VAKVTLTNMYVSLKGTYSRDFHVDVNASHLNNTDCPPPPPPCGHNTTRHWGSAICQGKGHKGDCRSGWPCTALKKFIFVYSLFFLSTVHAILQKIEPVEHKSHPHWVRYPSVRVLHGNCGASPCPVPFCTRKPFQVGSRAPWHVFVFGAVQLKSNCYNSFSVPLFTKYTGFIL
jgi:hypothetical protein